MHKNTRLQSELETWFRARGAAFAGELKWAEPLAKYTYYQIGGPATLLALPRSESDLEILSECIGAIGCKYFVLGAGSNLLVSDLGFEGIVIRASKMNTDIKFVDFIQSTEKGPQAAMVEAGSGAMISSLLRRATQEGWGGLEFLAGVPGTVGGAVKMNAGTHLGETQTRLTKVTSALLTSPLTWQTFEGEQLLFQYRKNLFLQPEAFVWSTLWKINIQDSASVKLVIDQTLARRKQTQPVDYPSCGSVFKNPKDSGMNAWQVIDKLGLRGHKMGNAQFAEKHSNFIINLGGAKASEVRDLIALAKMRAKVELSIELQEEVISVGETE